MDMPEDLLICRLCGIKVTEGNYKNIFKESTDLICKIKATLPISISLDDNGPKYICSSCYENISSYYKFVQVVVEHSKELENVSEIKSFFGLSKDVPNISQIHSDAVYSCPNCNVDLMILLVSNLQGCDTFQISLAMVNDSGKKYVTKGESKNIELLDNAGINELLNHEEKIEIVERTENTSDQVNVKQEQNFNYIGNQCLETERRKHCNVFDSSDSSIPKILKLAELSSALDENILGCDHPDADPSVKNEPESDDIYWANSGSEKNAYASDSQNIVQDDNDEYKSCLKYVCELCGARYLSRLKYEFHMERHNADKTNKYECIVCDKETRTENLLWDHYFHTHKSLQRYVCTECGKVFRKRSRLNVHQKNYKHCGIKQIQIDSSENTINGDATRTTAATTKQVSVNCNLCGKLISDLDPDAINDLVTCATCEDSTLSLMVDGNETKVICPRQYHCSKCPKHFVRKERLEFHEMRHNENMNEFICSTCGKEFKAENSLYEHHLFVHKGARPHVCELCGKSFQLKARLKEHHRTHTGERPYHCDVCDQQCKTANALKLHRKIHFSHSRYTCNICNKSFTKKQNMNEHLEKHWKSDKTVTLPQLFTCPICVEDFPTYRMLKSHMTGIHEINHQDPILIKQKPWHECGECHEKFKHQMSLKAHKEKVHEGKVNPVYRCDVCNATYRVKQLLVNHITSKHNGEKRYKCAQCEKGFNDTKSLYNHVLLHTGKKPYACEYCKMSFRRKDSRDHHRRKHTGEQPYQCPDCGESFSTYNHRSKHRKREHGEGDPECPECGQKCISQQEIRVHLNKHLGEKLKELENSDDV